MTNSFQKQLLALHYVYPLTWHKFQRLHQYIGDLNELAACSGNMLAKILNMKEDNASRLLIHYKKMLKIALEEYYLSHQITAVSYMSELYPESLKNIYDPPAVLYVKGDLNLLRKTKKIAVIGSRNASKYSEEALKLILPPLINEQFIIVSGLAKGADRFAHEATIRYGGKTMGVLGHGFFHFYPRENQKLGEQMAKEQLLLTEYPPYVGVKKWHFPARNRIISGLSQALIVTEAALKSGTLITTELALEQGKDVFAVPGLITSEQSKGTNKLIKEGAIPIWSGHQILDELQMFSNFR
ncbi:DNA-processing protein DprA [Solibacillus sp. FSL K6-1523]|uniref:DNA-processing protein DprA n=1 Tax=Solibacillus sp. FSL K6-1523 TaxID=2921471 RepID=UPI0030F4D8A8